jgi:hypothetical protein
MAKAIGFRGNLSLQQLWRRCGYAEIALGKQTLPLFLVRALRQCYPYPLVRPAAILGTVVAAKTTYWGSMTRAAKLSYRGHDAEVD